jgi:DNA repair photolyase
MDKKIGVTKELLKILKHYKYPYIIFTRSDLLAQDEYLNLIDPSLAGIQYSISSTNDAMNKLIEPGAPSAARRLNALSKINKCGFWTTVRINPLFPIYPDGFYSDPNFNWEGSVPQFNYSSTAMIKEIADAGVPSVLVGMGRFSSFSMNQIEKATGQNLRQFFKTDSEIKKSRRDYHFSPEETRAYYKLFKDECIKNSLEFTTCYIGNGEKQFWRDQDLWSNKIDCCNAKNRISNFSSDSREIEFNLRLKFTNKKDAIPNNPDSLHLELGKSKNYKQRSTTKIDSQPESLM